MCSNAFAFAAFIWAAGCVNPENIAAALGGGTEGPSKIWEINLFARAADVGLPHSDYYDVYFARFSPDSSRVAVLFGFDYRPALGITNSGPAARSVYLLVAPVQHPRTTIYWAADLSSSAGGLSLAWAPDGNSVLVSGKLWIRLPGGEQCRTGDWIPEIRYPAFAGFLSHGQALFAVPDVSVRKGLPPTILLAVGPECGIQERWASKDHLEIRGVSGDGRVIAARAHDSGTTHLTSESAAGRFLLLEPGAPKRVRMPIPADHFLASPAVFPDGGKLVCAAVEGQSYPSGLAIYPDSIAPIEARILCWDIHTGKRVQRSRYVWRRLNPGSTFLLDLTAGGGRIAVSDGGPARMVWDVATGRVIAWNREGATLQGVFAISPDGKLVLEAGPGLLRVSQLP